MAKNQTTILQEQLVDYCRTGKPNGLEYMDQERLAHYRRLVFNIIKDSLKTAYPITYEVLTSDEWGEMVRNFFKEHPCREPQVWRMPLELIEYVENNNLSEKFEKPWLLELLYFEWLEIEIYSMKEGVVSDYQKSKNYLTEIPILNPDYKIVQFNYPIHRINKETINSEKGNYFLLIFRSRKDWKVYFIEINEFLANLLENLKFGDQKLNKTLILLCEKFKLDPVEEIFSESFKFMQKLETKGMLLGSRKKSI